MKRLITLIFGLFCLSSLANADVFEKTKASTVMITNEAENSGGSGTIIKSTPSASLVLTNAHVCGLLENGGKVITTKGTKHQARKYKTSKQHDLCLVTVAEDLGVNTSLAYSAPEEGDSIMVSGHPYLFPHINAPGHITGKMDVTMIASVENCNKKEFEEYPLMCAFFGMPIIKKYETRVVSSMIAPGNSGSGVYDSNGDLVGVVFAGAGRGYSNGIIVPYEYVRGFLKFESKKLKWKESKKSFKYTEYESRAYKTGKSINGIRFSVLKDKEGIIFPAILDKETDRLYQTFQCAVGTSAQCLGK